MTDLEEIPEDDTPMMYEKLPNIQPTPKAEPESDVKKVLNVMEDESSTRLGGLRD